MEADALKRGAVSVRIRTGIRNSANCSQIACMSNGVVGEVWLDTKGKGNADQREVYKDGQRVALEADTNADRLVDVVQVFAGGQLARQDEDTDFDGVIDQRFEGDKPAAVPPGAKISATKFGPLDCGRFSEFWTRR